MCSSDLDTLIKCIIVASGNDACVAMAEYIAGNEQEFVKRMNERAAELGMSNTHFEDCCGLTDSDGHYTSARDVALMSRELITRYPQIFDYSGIWMENIIHTTAKGSSEFGLANTNKLLKQYQWATGLKTGSTSKAKYCVSATARKDDIDLIAVIMAAPDYKARFSEAVRLLDYGYANCSLYRDENKDSLNDVPVAQGVKDSVTIGYRAPFSYLSTSGEDIGQIEKKINLKEMQDKVADFMIEFEGVAKVMTAYSLTHTSFPEGVNRLVQNSFSHKRSGDVFFCIHPTWVSELKELEDTYFRHTKRPIVPLYLYGAGVKADLKGNYTMSDLLPTLCKILGINVPYTAHGKAMF